MKLKKGSRAAKAYMAKLRAMRASNPRRRKHKRAVNPAPARRVISPGYIVRLVHVYGRIDEARKAAQAAANRLGVKVGVQEWRD